MKRGREKKIHAMKTWPSHGGVWQRRRRTADNSGGSMEGIVVSRSGSEVLAGDNAHDKSWVSARGVPTARKRTKRVVGAHGSWREGQRLKIEWPWVHGQRTW